MTQLGPTFGPPTADPPARPRRCVCRRRAVAGTGLPVQVVSCGVPVPLRPAERRGAPSTARSSTRTPAKQFRRGAGIDDMPIFLFSPRQATRQRDCLQPHVRAGRGHRWRIRRPAAPAARSAATSCDTRS